jgi:CubicO group peptidase (beta-lactamase class C family)
MNSDPSSPPANIKSNKANASSFADRVDAIIDDVISTGRIVGAVVLIARDGEIVHRRATGFADRENKRRMEEDTLFRLASVTKPIVTAATLTLIEDGTISLDDPVTRWLPAFQPRLSGGKIPVITVTHLLSHTAGLNYGFKEERSGPLHRLGVSDGIDRVGFDLDENLRRLTEAPLLFAPGTNWHYSLATDVLGRLLEIASGQPLADLVRERVTLPLSMVDTDFVLRSPDRLAVAYADSISEPVQMSDPHELPFDLSAVRFSPSRAFDPTVYASAGAGMVGTAGDILRLLEIFRNGGAPLFGPEIFESLISDRVKPDFVERPDPGWGFGLGFGILDDPAAAGTPQPRGTWRWGGVYGHHWFVDPTNRLTVVTLTNTAVAGSEGSFPEALRSAVY